MKDIVEPVVKNGYQGVTSFVKKAFPLSIRQPSGRQLKQPVVRMPRQQINSENHPINIILFSNTLSAFCLIIPINFFMAMVMGKIILFLTLVMYGMMNKHNFI